MTQEYLKKSDVMANSPAYMAAVLNKLPVHTFDTPVVEGLKAERRCITSLGNTLAKAVDELFDINQNLGQPNPSEPVKGEPDKLMEMIDDARIIDALKELARRIKQLEGV